MAERFEYRFDWDPTKAARNAKDHGVTFEQAATVFLCLGSEGAPRASDSGGYVNLASGRRAETGLMLLCLGSEGAPRASDSGGDVNLASGRRAATGLMLPIVTLTPALTRVGGAPGL